VSAAADGDELATATASAAKVRRYRLGRMPLYTRPGTISDRHGHLRRGYD
jgi:hypothetical protein